MTEGLRVHTDVDWPEDFKLAEMIYKQKLNNEPRY